VTPHPQDACPRYLGANADVVVSGSGDATLEGIFRRLIVRLEGSVSDHCYRHRNEPFFDSHDVTPQAMLGFDATAVSSGCCLSGRWR